MAEKTRGTADPAVLETRVDDPVVHEVRIDGPAVGTGAQVRVLDPLEDASGVVLTGSFGLSGGSLMTESGESNRRGSREGKDVAVEEEPPRVIDPFGIVFRPSVGSSSATPIVREDFVEFIGAANMARLDPGMAELIYQLRVERLREIALSDEAARLKREQEEMTAQETDLEDEMFEEPIGPRIPAIEVARHWTRPAFDASSYILPEPHLIIPSGYEAHDFRQEEYDPDLILRDPETHLSRTWMTREQDSLRAHGGVQLWGVLALFRRMPPRVQELVDMAGFGAFVRTLEKMKGDHAVLVALGERWHDASNTFHLSVGEMTLTPVDFAAITGLRVGGEPIPFDLTMHTDDAALVYFLGHVPIRERDMGRYTHLAERLQAMTPGSEMEEQQMVRMFILCLFATALFPNKRSHVHLSYLPALRDLRTAGRFDWGGVALCTCYIHMGLLSRGLPSIVGYWRAWEIWAYEVFRMYPPRCTHLDQGVFPRALKWSSAYGRKKVVWDPWTGRGVAEPSFLTESRRTAASRVLLESAFGWRWYLGERVVRQSLRADSFITPGPLPPRASFTDRYTLDELARFTTPSADLRRYQRPDVSYSEFQRHFLAGPLGTESFDDLKRMGREAGKERRVASSGRAKRKAVRIGGREREELPPPAIPRTIEAQGPDGGMVLVPLKEPESYYTVTGQVPEEWANEMLRWAAAVQIVVRRVASGHPLQTVSPYPQAGSIPIPRPRATTRRGGSCRSSGSRAVVPVSSSGGRGGQGSSTGTSEGMPRRSSRLQTHVESLRKRQREEEVTEASESSGGDDNDSVSDENFRPECFSDSGDDDDPDE